jgi:DNA-binding transcriptional regulator/RsmH inhibitor MraZ
MAEDLVGLAWGGLSEERRAEVERHAESCSGCRAELDEVRALRSAVAALGMIEPSWRFHERVLSRLEETDRRAGKLRELAPASPGPASRRLERLRERDRFLVGWVRPRWKILTLAASAAAAAAVLFATGLWRLPAARPRGPETVEFRPRVRGLLARRSERKTCRVRVEVTVEAGSLDVSGVLDDGEVVLTAAFDLAAHEKCLLAFRASEWESFSARPENRPGGPEHARFEAIAGLRRPAEVRGGSLEVPDELMAGYLDGESEVVLLRLRGRSEIWTRENFADYLKRDLPEQITVPISALPPVGAAGNS